MSGDMLLFQQQMTALGMLDEDEEKRQPVSIKKLICASIGAAIITLIITFGLIALMEFFVHHMS